MKNSSQKFKTNLLYLYTIPNNKSKFSIQISGIKLQNFPNQAFRVVFTICIQKIELEKKEKKEKKKLKLDKLQN